MLHPASNDARELAVCRGGEVRGTRGPPRCIKRPVVEYASSSAKKHPITSRLTYSTTPKMRFSTLLPVAALVAVAAAAPGALEARQSSQCSTGPVQCCDSTQESSATSLSELGGLLGLVLPSIEGLIGLDCSPITALGVSGNSCTAQAVCCSNNNFNGLINLGCSPINLNL
ncbi:Fungal hydrophobin domain containing protein [Tylopilus felleus]